MDLTTAEVLCLAFTGICWIIMAPGIIESSEEDDDDEG